jgi:hypothetical protein
MSCCAFCSCSTSSGFPGAAFGTSAVGKGSDLMSPAETSFVIGTVGEKGGGTAAGVGSGSIGVSGGVASFASFNRRASRFFSSVRRKTLIVVRNDLWGLQSSDATGLCSQTGHVDGKLDWPIVRSAFGTLIPKLKRTHKFRISIDRSTEAGRR